MTGGARRDIDAPPRIGIERQFRKIEGGSAPERCRESCRESLHLDDWMLRRDRRNETVEHGRCAAALRWQAPRRCAGLGQEAEGLLVLLIGDEAALGVE